MEGAMPAMPHFCKKKIILNLNIFVQNLSTLTVLVF